MMNDPEFITAAWLNRLAPEKHIAVLKGPFGTRMHGWVAGHVTYLRWNRVSLLGKTTTNIASHFFLDFGDTLFAITEAHAYDAYLDAKKKSGNRLNCQIENMPFDLESRAAGRCGSKALDIATFEISRHELATIGKHAVSARTWPPPVPVEGQEVFLAGFSCHSGLWAGWQPMSCGLHVGQTTITKVTDERVACAFEPEFWMAPEHAPLPPEGFDTANLCGGPLLIPVENDGQWQFALGGVISDAVLNEAVYAVPARFIHPDGRIGPS